MDYSCGCSPLIKPSISFQTLRQLMLHGLFLWLYFSYKTILSFQTGRQLILHGLFLWLCYRCLSLLLVFFCTLFLRERKKEKQSKRYLVFNYLYSSRLCLQSMFFKVKVDNSITFEQEVTHCFTQDQHTHVQAM